MKPQGESSTTEKKGAGKAKVAVKIASEIKAGKNPVVWEGAGEGEVEPKISPRCKDLKRVVGAESLAAEWEGAAREEVGPKMVPKNIPARKTDGTGQEQSSSQSIC